MKNAIIVHGTPGKEEYYSDKYPSSSNQYWIPWLQKQLLIKGIYTQTPEMSDAYKPDYKKWKKEFNRYDVDENSILIGHSCGGGFLVRWLSENKTKVNKVILVAPWLDPDREKTTSFFDFKIDPEITKRVSEVHIMFSEDDYRDILTSVETIRKALPDAQIHTFKNMGHFIFGDMKKCEFPELLELILK